MRGKKKRVRRSKRAKGAQLNLWIKDPTAINRFNRLAKKWADEGKIVSRGGAAFVHMLELAENPPVLEGNLPLEPKERQMFSVLGDMFRYVGLAQGASDLEVVRAMVSYLSRWFSNNANLHEFLQTKGG